MTGFDWILAGVTGVSLLWLALVIRENRDLHRQHEADAADFLAMSVKAAKFSVDIDEALGTIVDLYEEELAKR